MTTEAEAQPVNDDCASAITISDGNTAFDTTGAAKKRGRKAGTPKTGGAGHYTPEPGLKGAPLRAWMLSQSGAIETLVRLSKGRAIKLHGPTGKVTWHYPSPEQVLWAVERILRKALPDLSGITLSGEKDGEPIRTSHRTTNSLGENVELARRLRLALDMGEKAQQESQDAPTNGRPLGKGNGGSGAQRVLEAPAESSNGQCSPAVGEATVVDKARGISVVRVSHDGRSDGGGDWDVQQRGKRVKVLRGITAEAAAQVVQALDAEGRFDE